MKKCPCPPSCIASTASLGRAAALSEMLSYLYSPASSSQEVNAVVSAGLSLKFYSMINRLIHNRKLLKQESSVVLF